MAYISKAARVNKWNKQAKVYSNLATVLNVFAEVANKFDGKVLNKRFSEALQAAIPDNLKDDWFVSIGTETLWDGTVKKSIGIITTDRCQMYNVHNCVYIEENRFDIQNNGRYMGKDVPLWLVDGKRINAKSFVENVLPMIEYYTKKAEEYSKCASHYDEYVAKVNEMKAEYNSWYEQLPWLFRDGINQTCIAFPSFTD